MTIDPKELPHPLGRLLHHDPRNKDFRALVKPPPRSPTAKNLGWFSNIVFDQGDTPRCTTEAAVGLLHTNPYRPQHVPDQKLLDEPAERQAFYLASQDFDPYPGHDYDGTSTDAPFKLLRNRGLISAWRWLFGEDEVREYLRWYGPVVVGTVWLMDMFNPTKKGFLNVTGEEAGGHAYRIIQYSPTRNAYRMINSWGQSWGQDGRAWIAAVDLAALLSNNGEAVTIS